MKVRIFFLKFLMLSMTMLSFPGFSSHVMAADADNCILCHKYSGLGRIDENGNKHLYYVNESSYLHSAHGRLRCKDCHTNIEKFPHVDLEKVNCATVCHVNEPSVGRKFSHKRMIEDFENSVHGKSIKGEKKEYAEDLPSCTYCHQNRILTSPKEMQGKMQEIAQEILDRCLGCHEDENWTTTYFLHLTHRMKQRRASKDMVELCASCHEDEEKMGRHGLEATGKFRDSFHWQAIKYDYHNAPNCIDCHAPVGYFSHSIMPKTDPRSAIHKDNLLQTCSNMNGTQTCHPDATELFAQGKVHPSGEMASLFDTGLALVERKKLIQKGEIKPFKSLLPNKTQEESSKVEYYQNIVLILIKYLYKFLIGGLISFMIIHQILDFFSTRRDMKKGGHR